MKMDGQESVLSPTSGQVWLTGSDPMNQVYSDVASESGYFL